MGALALLLSSACLSAPVSYGPPSTPGDAPQQVPWVRSGAIVGYLFYYGSPGPWQQQRDRVLIPVGGSGAGVSAKILWYVPGGGRRITLWGQRLDGEGKSVSVQRISGSPGGGYFATITVVPNAGCWRLTVGSGKRSARFAFVAVDL
jgi:hypothetical protein